MRFVFIDADGREATVSSPEQARALAAAGRLGPDTMVRTEDNGPWRPAREALTLEQLVDPSQVAAARIVTPREGRGGNRGRQNPKPALRIIGRIFMLLGLVGLLVGAGVALWQWNRLSGMTTTEGTVVALEMKWGNSTAVRPVVEYQAADGTTHQYVSPVNSSTPLFDTGDKVTIHYDPANPDDAIMDHWTSWFFALLPAGMGLVFFLVGTGLSIGGHQRRLPPAGPPGGPSAVERRR